MHEEAEWTQVASPSNEIQDMLERFLRNAVSLKAQIMHRWAASVDYVRGAPSGANSRGTVLPNARLASNRLLSLSVLIAIVLFACVAILSRTTDSPELAANENRANSTTAGSQSLASIDSSQGVRVHGEDAARGAPAEEEPDNLNLRPFEFHVEVRDSEGRPYTGVEVQVAPQSPARTADAVWNGIVPSQ